MSHPTVADGKGPIGVLLVNSGTPNALTTAAVRSFLKGLLGDPRVVELPRLLWLPILYGFILPLRPGRVLEKYRRIWTPQGSPLSVISEMLRQSVKERLEQRLGETTEVELGMLYSSPGVTTGLERLHARGAKRLLILPLFPQYSGATIGAVHDRVSSELRTRRHLPEVRYVNGYSEDPVYLEGVAASVREHWAAQGRTQHLLVSFHGIPERYHAQGDPYAHHCRQTARELAQRLGLSESEWTLAFQSRFGAAEWLKPYTIDTVAQLPRRGIGSVTVVCPGFAIDCLETLEEIDIENRQAFMNAGGRDFQYVPALNASAAQARLLTELILRHAQGWTGSRAA